MKSFRAYTLLRPSGMRRKGESLQLASLDGDNFPWQFTFIDPTQGDELIDPATARTVDKVHYTEFWDVETIASGQDAIQSYESKYPYNGHTIHFTGCTITQDGPPVPVVMQDGTALNEWMLYYNVVTQNA